MKFPRVKRDELFRRRRRRRQPCCANISNASQNINKIRSLPYRWKNLRRRVDSMVALHIEYTVNFAFSILSALSVRCPICTFLLEKVSRFRPLRWGRCSVVSCVKLRNRVGGHFAEYYAGFSTSPSECCVTNSLAEDIYCLGRAREIRFSFIINFGDVYFLL